MLKTIIRQFVAAVAIVLISGGLTAKADGGGRPRTISGVVTDNTGAPVIGANLVLVGAKNTGTMTDIDGRFTINVPETGRLEISCLGFETVYLTLDASKDQYRVVMQESATLLDDVVVVGYGVQKKESVVGAISQVQGETLVNSGVSNITNALSGKLSGVTTIQSSGQPGADDAEIVIRGVSSFGNNSPLVLVDGVERDFASIDPDEVDNISVLKDASATAVFGAKGANGVIIVTTKTGSEGKPKMKISVQQGFAMPINLPQHVDSYTTMSLLNVALMNDQEFDGLSSQAVLNEYRSPSSPLNAIRYPDVDWVSELTKSFAPTTNANFNISGGTKFVKYFASVGYTNQGSLFKNLSDDKVNTGFSYHRLNFRSNVDFNFTKSTKLSFKLGGNVGVRSGTTLVENYPDKAWKSMFSSSTSRFPLYYPAWVLSEIPDLDYPDANEDRLVKSNDQNSFNPYSMMMSGSSKQYTDTKVFSDIILNQKLDFITEGLSVQGKVSLSTYYKYATLNTYPSSDRPEFQIDYNKLGTGLNPWDRSSASGYVDDEVTLVTSAPNSLQSNFYMDLYYDLSLNYNRTFGDHNVTGLFLFNRQEQMKGSDFPYYNEALVARATYDYAHRYLVEFNMGYTGSERFAPKNRFGFFPSGALGWVMSEEKFMQPLKPWLSKLKFRFSMGLVGSDYADNRWLYISNYVLDTAGYIREDSSANLSAQWEQALKKDLGVEMGFFNNDLVLTVDLFDEYRDKMLITVKNNTPLWLGIDSKELNKGAIKKHGIEIEANYRKKFGQDWTFNVGGNFSFTENRVVYADDAPYALDHQRSIGAPIGTATTGTYLIDGGYLVSIDDIHSSFLPVTMDRLVVGDYKYLDLTADGKINQDDAGLIRGSYYPPISFAFNTGFSWKGLEFSVLFQGYAGKYTQYGGGYEIPFIEKNYVTHKSGLDCWSPSNPTGNHSAAHFSKNTDNTNWISPNTLLIEGRTWRRSDYVRLKEASLSYTWSGREFRRKTGMQGIKLYVTGNNLLTFTGLLEGDPESKVLTDGAYPHMRTVKLGLQFTF